MQECNKKSLNFMIRFKIRRYLYNQPDRPEDKLHQVKTFFGNGVSNNLLAWVYEYDL